MNIPVTFEIRSGLKASLPSTGSIIGEPFFCKDTGELFIWNGSVMKAIGSAQAVISVCGKTGAVTLTTSDITGLDAALATFATSSALTSEATTRASADATLATAITSEAGTRAAADTAEATARGTAVSNEATARANADTTLQGNITAEATTRASADTAEAAARATADALLQPTSEKGAVNGYASLDGSGKVPSGQLPPISSTLAADTDVALTTLVDKDVLTYDFATSKWKNKPSGAAGRTTANITAAGLGAGALQQGTVALAKTFALQKIVVTVSSRLRLYSTVGARDSDAGRGQADFLDSSTQHGCICDIYLDSSTGLTWILNPTALGTDAKGSPDGNIAYNLTNASAVQQDVSVTLTYLSEES